MPSIIIFGLESFLFILYTILFAQAWQLIVASNSNSSSNSDSSDVSSSRNNIVYNIKRFDRKRGTKWQLFIEYLKRRYEFTLKMAVQELSDGTGISPLTVRQYVYFAKEMGLLEIRAVLRRGRRRVYIYRSLLYNRGDRK